MIGLAIHTSSPELGLALTNLDTVERHQVWPLGRDLTQYLHPCLAEFMAPYTWADLAFLAVAKGPGGFTGTRIGVVVARTLAQQLSIPLFGVSSLAAIAHQHVLHNPLTFQQTPAIAVAMRAQRGEVFGAIYQPYPKGLTIAHPETVHTQAEWEVWLKSWPQPYHLITAEGGLADSVTGVLSLAKLMWTAGDRPSWQTVLPFYGQHPVR